MISDQLPESYCAGKSDLEIRLLRRAYATLWNNILIARPDEVFPWGDRRVIAPSLAVYRGVWNWDSAFHAMAVCRFDPDWARDQLAYFLEYQRADGALIDSYQAYGYPGETVDGLSKPPIVFPAYERIDRADPDTGKLRPVYGKLVRYAEFWETKRCDRGLFFYSCDVTEDRDTCAKWESGMDNSPRFDGGITEQIWAIDLNCYMVLAYRSLQYMANRLGETADAILWANKEQALSERIRATLWNESANVFCDRFRTDSESKSGFTGVLTPVSFLPLFTGVATDRQAEKMAELATDPQQFYPLMPSCAYRSDVYDARNFWRGPTWINITYFATEGLRRYGYTELADGYRQRILTMCDKEARSLFEYYDSRTGEGIGAADYGWTAAFILEWILGK